LTATVALVKNEPVRRPASIVLLLIFTAIGSGALAYLHQAAHALADQLAREHAAPHAGCRHHHHEEDDPAPAHHDESNCPLHAMLRAPLFHGASAPLPALTGTFVERADLPAAAARALGVVLHVTCRGPPDRLPPAHLV
jgi:hypothetical protein